MTVLDTHSAHPQVLSFVQRTLEMDSLQPLLAMSDEELRVHTRAALLAEENNPGVLRFGLAADDAKRATLMRGFTFDKDELARMYPAIGQYMALEARAGRNQHVYSPDGQTWQDSLTPPMPEAEYAAYAQNEQRIACQEGESDEQPIPDGHQLRQPYVWLREAARAYGQGERGHLRPLVYEGERYQLMTDLEGVVRRYAHTPTSPQQRQDAELMLLCASRGWLMLNMD